MTWKRTQEHKDLIGELNAMQLHDIFIYRSTSKVYVAVQRLLCVWSGRGVLKGTYKSFTWRGNLYIVKLQ